MQILFIHGRAQGGKDPSQLHQSWIDALQDGFKNANIDFPTSLSSKFPFYGDLLDGYASTRMLNLRDMEKSGFPDEYRNFLDEALSEMISAQGKTPREFMDEVAPDTIGKRGFLNSRFILEAIAWIDTNFPQLSGAGIELLLRDVFLYLHDKEVRDAVDGVVKQSFTNQPTLIIAHSLGSVVAYNLLRNGAFGDSKKHKLITVGSPLGLNAFDKSLGMRINPMSKGAWFNAHDPKDIVALYPLSHPYFDVDPDILNHGKVKNKTANHHGISGYLDDEQVAASIAKALSD